MTHTDDSVTPVLVIAGTGVPSLLAPLLYRRLNEVTKGAFAVTAIPAFGLGHITRATEKISELFLESNTPFGKRSDFILIGHSQGGLIALALANKYQTRVRKVITLGAPFFGTSLSNLRIPLSSARCMAQDSRWLQDMVVPKEVPVHSVFTSGDRVVVPFTSSFLPGATNVVVSKRPYPVAGCDWISGEADHLSLIHNAEVLAYIKEVVADEKMSTVLQRRHAS